MAQPQHHFLPALDPELAGVPMPAVSAHWSAQPSSLLQSIGKGIAVDESAVTRGVSSVPDVWARAVLFQSALRTGHPLHAEAIADWRGLLSLLALREIYGYNVEVVPVPMGGGGKLEGALRTLAPAPVPLQADTLYDWTDVLLIRLDGIPIGAFSPGSLVYTATGYRQRLRDHYEPEGQEPRRRPEILGDDYELQAPTKSGDEFSAHYVAEYVYDLYTACSALFSDAPAAQRTSELLETWLAELRRDFGYNPQAAINAPEVKRDDTLPSEKSAADWPRMSAYEVYRQALLPLVPDDDGNATGIAGKSTIFLRHRRNHTDYQGLVVVHKDTLTDQAKVWGLRQLASLGETPQEALDAHFDASQGDQLAGEDLRKHEAAWIRPERYFLTDVLLAPHQGTKVLADDEQGANGGGDYLLPFTREVLDFFGPDAIQSVLNPRFEDLRGGGVRFSFDLPVGQHPSLTAGDGQVGPSPVLTNASDPFANVASVRAQSDPTITVERVYKLKASGDADDGSGTIVRTDLPVLDLFPDYLGPSWRRYYLFQSDADTFDCRPYAHGAAFESRDGDAFTDTIDGVQQRARVMEVHGDDPFPDGVEIRAANGTPIGLVVVPHPLWDVPGVTGHWTVGIDFGTSNTNIAVQEGTNPVKGWVADFPAFLRPLASDPGGRRDALLQSFFVPNRQVSFPVSTLLDIWAPNPLHGRPFLDYSIEFPDEYTWRSRVRTNIKWDSKDGRVTEFFLEPLLMLVLLESTRQGVATVTLRCTFPKAFTRGQRDVLEGEWTRTLKALVDPQNPEGLIGAVPNQTVSVSEPTHHSEGQMAGVYFSNESPVAAAKSICVDVGGGTSDIALIYGGPIVYDSSIKMAGGNVSSYIAARPKLQRILFSERAQAALTATQGHDQLFGACINEVLRAEKERIPDQLNRNATNPDVVQLRQLIALKFGALAFHVGTVLGAVERRGITVGLADQLREGGISVHWGGNGGQLATWIDFGNYRPDGLAAQMLNGLMFYALKDAEITPNARLLMQAQSRSPKGEASRGVVTDYAGNKGGGGGQGYEPEFLLDDEVGGDDVAATIEGVISGENITLTDGSEVSFLDPITLATMFDGDRTRFAKSSGDRLRRFISLFNGLGAKFDLITADTKIPDDDSTITRIVENAQGAYVKMQDKQEVDRAVEPVFITEVRELMDFVTSGAR